MKKVFAIAAFSLVVAYCAAVAVMVLTPLNPLSKGEWLHRGGDFMLRVSEIDCLLDGVNPYYVWNGDIVKKPYVPNYGAPRAAVEGKEGFTEFINAYAPWEYIMMMPFALLPRTVSWVLYFGLMMAGVFALFFFGRAFCRRTCACGDEVACVASALSILFVALPVYQNFFEGNLSVPVLLSVVLMACCLNRGWNALAGLCWAFAMIKPQLGLVFAIPLLLRRKFLTCFVAAAICLVLTAVSALLCRESPIALLFQASAASSWAFEGCGTFPKFLCGFFENGVGINIGLAVGAVLCAWMTWILRREKDWMVFLMPAAVMGASWTYAQCYSFTMNWFFFLILCISFIKVPHSRFLWFVATLAVLMMTRAYNLIHFIPKALPDVFPDIVASDSCHYHISSLITAASVVVLSAFCVWYNQCRKNNVI